MEQARRIPERYTTHRRGGPGRHGDRLSRLDETLKREVAIKVLHRHLAEPESKARLEREAQAVAKLRHENILEIFDYSGLESTRAYIVTEFIDGQTLKQFMAGAHAAPPRGRGDDRASRFAARSRTRTASACSTATSSPRT